MFPGCPVPLVHPAEDAAYVHGQDGFGDTGYAPAARAAETEHAALAILRLARERARLAAAGRPPPLLDGQIAATAATRNLILVTRNTRDFGCVDGLSLENWFVAGKE